MSLVCVAGCGILPEQGSEAPAGAVVGADDATVRPQSRPDGVEAVEAVPDEAPAPARSGNLGTTVASLGDAAQPGLWLKTPLVGTEQPGRVRSVETGQSVGVTLIPIEGPATAGSRLSLAAMQAIGAPLTGLPEVEVTAGG